MTNRVFNFSAGPAALPLEVLEQIKADLPGWQGSGMSVMEVSHRSKAFVGVAEQAEADLRALLNIGDDYAVLFLQGGATMQFGLLPLNLAKEGETVDYLVTGSWSKKAAKEAAAVRTTKVVATGEDGKFTDVPARDDWQCTAGAAYFHYCPNETIHGLEIADPPSMGDTPLVADMSSTILSRPVDVSRFGVIYAGAQKNIGPAGLTIMIVRKDLLASSQTNLPNIMRYAAQADAGSMLNTPPTFAWYVAGLVFAWLRRQGGLEAMAEVNRSKAEALYAAIDGSDFYANPVVPAHRSWMNVPFTLARPELDADFLAGSAEAGLTNLKGHRSVGGMRASIYNAVPAEAVTALIDYMQAFEKQHG